MRDLQHEGHREVGWVCVGVRVVWALRGIFSMLNGRGRKWAGRNRRSGRWEVIDDLSAWRELPRYVSCAFITPCSLST